MAPKILIIEDTEDIRDALVIVFTEAGFRVAAAERGEEAYEELAKFAPDIVLLDMQLPGMSGLDILKRMRKSVSVPILMYTNTASAESVREAIASGASDYVLKDTGMDELVERVNRRLEASGETGTPVVPVDPAVNPTVMYVGQDATVLSLISNITKRLAIESTRVTTAKVALNRISKVRPAIVITELNLRESDGLSLIKALKKEKYSSNIPVVVVADNAPPEIRRSALKHGATAFFIKPIDGNEFDETVKKLIRSLRRARAA